MPDSVGPVSESERVALVELINRVVDRGVTLSGDITISVADIDLLHVGLRLLLCSADRVGQRHSGVELAHALSDTDEAS